MKFIVGLGNPGAEYTQTRHNVGFMLLDELVRQENAGPWQDSKKLWARLIKTPDVVYLEPQTFMNNSGQAVRAVMEYYGAKVSESGASLDNVYVIHDDLDIQLGQFKIQLGKGPKVHNGLGSVYDHLKTTQFWHVRVGVDNRNGARTMPGQSYVLQAFLSDEQPVLSSVINECIQSIKLRALS